MLLMFLMTMFEEKLHSLVYDLIDSRDGDLVLMDAGCEYNGYVSDITRTWPVSGKFSEVQKKLYEIVLRVQLHCIEV